MSLDFVGDAGFRGGHASGHGFQHVDVDGSELSGQRGVAREAVPVFEGPKECIEHGFDH